MKIQQSLSKTILLASLAIGASNIAWAHATLQNATPAKGEEVTSAPTEVKLQFNEKLEAAFSTAKVVDSAGKVVTTEKAALDASDPTVLKVALPKLTTGKYTVRFVAVGHDGHPRKGDYSFTIK